MRCQLGNFYWSISRKGNSRQPIFYCSDTDHSSAKAAEMNAASKAILLAKASREEFDNMLAVLQENIERNANTPACNTSVNDREK